MKALALGLAILVYSILVFWGDSAEMFAALVSVPGDMVLLATMLAVANFILRAVRWHAYLYCLDVRIPVTESFIIFLAGFSMTLTPGKVGEFIKSYLIKEGHGVPMTRTAPIIVAERITDLAGLVVMLAVGSLHFTYGLPVALVSGALVLLLIAVSLFKPIGDFFIRVLARLPYVKRFAPTAGELYASLQDLSGPGILLPAILLSIVAWGSQGLCLYVVADAVVPGALSVLASMFAYAMPLLVGTMAMLPGGLGLAEGSMAGVLTSFPEVTLVAASAITILVRLITFWLAIAIGFMALGAWKPLYGPKEKGVSS